MAISNREVTAALMNILVIVLKLCPQESAWQGFVHIMNH